MRLSDAIALGRTMIRPAAGRIRESEDSGCALGMGLAAIGRFHDYVHVPSIWTWAREASQLPCDCPFKALVTATHVVMHLFDIHVMQRKDWTLDQLIDWVRSVEPAEEPEATPTEQHAAVEVKA